MLFMMLLFMQYMSQCTIMSVCDGEKDMEEVRSAWFSEHGGYVVDEKEAGEDIEDDMEEDMEETMVD